MKVMTIQLMTRKKKILTNYQNEALFKTLFFILRSHLATSFNQNQRMCVTRSTWNPIWRFPLTKATWDPIWRPHSTGTKECVKSGLIIMGDLPKWKGGRVLSFLWVTYPGGKNMKCGLIVMGDLPRWKKYDEVRSHCHGWPTRMEKMWYDQCEK